MERGASPAHQEFEELCDEPTVIYLDHELHVHILGSQLLLRLGMVFAFSTVIDTHISFVLIIFFLFVAYYLTAFTIA